MKLIIKNAHRLTRHIRLRSSYLVASPIFARGKPPLVANCTTDKHRICRNIVRNRSLRSLSRTRGRGARSRGCRSLRSRQRTTTVYTQFCSAPLSVGAAQNYAYTQFCSAPLSVGAAQNYAYTAAP